MLEQIWLMPGWEDDPVQRQDRRIRLGIRDVGCQEGGVVQVQ